MLFQKPRAIICGRAKERPRGVGSARGRGPPEGDDEWRTLSLYRLPGLRATALQNSASSRQAPHCRHMDGKRSRSQFMRTLCPSRRRHADPWTSSSFGGRRPIRNLRVEDGEVWPAPGDGLQRARAAIRDALGQASIHSHARFEAKAKGEDAGKPVMYVVKTDTSVGKTKEVVDWMLAIHEERPTVPYAPKEGGPAGEAMLPMVYAGPSWKLGKEVSLRMVGAGHEAGKIGSWRAARGGEAKNAWSAGREARRSSRVQAAGTSHHGGGCRRTTCAAPRRRSSAARRRFQSVEWEGRSARTSASARPSGRKRKWNVTRFAVASTSTASWTGRSRRRPPRRSGSRVRPGAADCNPSRNRRNPRLVSSTRTRLEHA